MNDPSPAVRRVLAQLDSRDCRPKVDGAGWKAKCPAHDDRNPSLSIGIGVGGKAMVHCHASCSFEAIVAALGLEPRDLAGESSNGHGANGHCLPKPKPPKSYPTANDAITSLERLYGKRTGHWVYEGRDEKPVGVVLRFDPPNGKKSFRPVFRFGDAWCAAHPSPRPLYRLPDLLKAGIDDPVLLLEGEKCADLAAGLGFLATTASGGADSTRQADWSPMMGRTVFIVRDNNKAGITYRDGAAAGMARLNPAPIIKAIDLPGLADGEDIEQWIAKGGTADELRQLMADAPLYQPPAANNGTKDPTSSEPVIVTMADVEPCEVSWLWPGRIALGRLSLLVGNPGLGKSFLTIDMASRVSTGTPWPDGQPCPRGSVVFISAEDDPADTIRPRLDAHYADVKRVHLLSGVRFTKDKESQEVLITLHHVRAIEEALEQVRDCKLLVVDPIGSFLGGNTDANRDNEVRSVLAPIGNLAKKFGCAVVVVAHRRKSAAVAADDMTLGSRGFTGIARSVWHLSRDPDDKSRRLLLPGKNNLAPEGDGLAFTILGEPARISWEHDPVVMTADEALASEAQSAHERAKPGPKPVMREQAEEWLASMLAAAPVPVAQLKAEATAAGLAWRSVERARQCVGVLRQKVRFDGQWTWALPTRQDPAESTRQDPKETNDLATWRDGKNAEENDQFQDTETPSRQVQTIWRDGTATAAIDEPF